MALATPFASASLYVGDLVNDVTEALLFEVFNAVGPVASVRVCRDAATRRSLGYAYVNFHRVEDAERALDTMNFKPIRNRPCRIMWSHRDPSLRKSGLGNIFVKNLHSSIDNKQLYDTFSMFGNILSVKVSTNSQRESLGYGFVHYESAESAQDAVARVNGKVIAGQKVIVSPFRSKKERGVEENAGVFTNIYVKNLPEDATEEAMKELFTKHGEITSSKLAVDDEGKPKGFGFINFETPEQATAAVEALNGHEWSEKKLFVARAQKRDEREKELRDRFEQLKAERQKKYEGVNLYVKNLSDDITDDRLREEFKQFGNVTSCKIMIDAAGKSRGFGFVCFASPEEATKAVTEMSNRMLEGKPLYVSLAQRKEARRAQLELQHTQRGGSKMGGVPPQPQMYPPQGAPMFYAPGIPPRNFMYPQQMMQQQQQQRRWQPGNPGNPPQMVMGGMQTRPVGNYQLMPVPGQNNPRNGSSGGRNNRRNHNMQGGKQGNGQMQGQRRQMQQQQQQGVPQQQQQQQQQFRGQQQQQVPQQVPQEQAPEASPAIPAAVEGESAGVQPLTIKALAAAPKGQQKQMIGERLFPLVKGLQPEKAGKITGMLLEMDNGELIHLLESDQALNEKIGEACTVLEAAGQ
jgi:polyadenylate-binding protein